MRIKDIVIIGMLGALLFVVQVALRMIPNVELISFLIIIYTLVMNKKTLYIITVFIFLELFLYGFGLWWLNYLYIWFGLYGITRIFKKERSPFLWAIISGGFGFSFGALCAIPYFFMGLSGGTLRNGFQSAFAYWIAGIPFDIPHGIGNFLIALVLFKPVYTILNHLINTYNPSPEG
jgi:energy-coupling factor transport system substrate-specific component